MELIGGSDLPLWSILLTLVLLLGYVSFRGRTLILDVADPEFLRLSMVKDFSSMENRRDHFFGNIFDCFLTSLTGDHWRHVRACLSPTFTSGKLNQLKARIDVCANQFVKYVADTKEQPFDLKKLTKDEVVANAVLFFLAGYETTALTLHYVLYELTINPDIQKRVYEEITTNMSGEEASYDELSKMEYVDWILQETMRLYPAAPRIERLVNKDTTVAGIHLPAGSMVSAMVYSIHHDPEIWPDPEEFDSERFSPENREGRHQYAWIPFGLGNRNCIGMRLALLNMKIAMVKILRKYVLEPCEGTPSKPMKWAKNFRLDPEKRIMISARRRKQAADS